MSKEKENVGLSQFDKGGDRQPDYIDVTWQFQAMLRSWEDDMKDAEVFRFKPADLAQFYGVDVATMWKIIASGHERDVCDFFKDLAKYEKVEAIVSRHCIELKDLEGNLLLSGSDYFIFFRLLPPQLRMLKRMDMCL